MENISQTSPPRKRGRPRKAAEAAWQIVDKVYPHTSHRLRANHLYGMRAYRVLHDDPRFAWVMAARRDTILNELGRVSDDQNLRTIALDLCAHQPTTRQALARIRAFRQETLPPATACGLQAVLHTAIETYLAEHADVDEPADLVAAALAAAGEHYRFPWRWRRATLPPARSALQCLVDALRQRDQGAGPGQARQCCTDPFPLVRV
jgi:hypothetical protein